MAVIILSLQARQYIGSPTTREIVEIEIAENIAGDKNVEKKNVKINKKIFFIYDIIYYILL